MIEPRAAPHVGQMYTVQAHRGLAGSILAWQAQDALRMTPEDDGPSQRVPVDRSR